MNARITKIRKSAKMTQEQFAQKMGISKNYVNLIENGKKKPGNRLISDICREFHINEEWLRTGKGEMHQTVDMNFENICADIGVHDPKAKAAILKYYELSQDDKELWWRYVERFMK